ncbi:hypothetical protein TorRG33x02_151840 [Trema orientale]|uniref:Uncharacterized protein n=1 Tax=Trema orientale TaxID=63057 RepID=A0A2P5ETW7_TREOI|nr:hypothetical protein TorRG33x02_151840 [Trema orientale]
MLAPVSPDGYFRLFNLLKATCSLCSHTCCNIYNFFPTDFVYPRPADSAAPKSVAPLQIRRRDHDIADDDLLLERRQSKLLNDISLRCPAKAAALLLKLKPQQKERGGSANSLPLL